MINERYTLAKLPLRGLPYCYVTRNKLELRVVSRVFRAEAIDYRIIASGTAFKTAEAAEREKYNVYNGLRGKEWER